MKIIKLLDRHIEEFLLLILSIVMVSVISLQVAMRISGNSLSWSEELARYCFVWLIYIGISYGVKKQKHINIDVLLILLKGRKKLALQMIANLLFLFFSLYVVVYGYKIAETLLSFGQVSPGLGIEMGYVYLATPIGFGLTSIRLIQIFIIQVKAFKANKPDEVPVEEV